MNRISEHELEILNCQNLFHPKISVTGNLISVILPWFVCEEKIAELHKLNSGNGIILRVKTNMVEINFIF